MNFIFLEKFLCQQYFFALLVKKNPIWGINSTTSEQYWSFFAGIIIVAIYSCSSCYGNAAICGTVLRYHTTGALFSVSKICYETRTVNTIKKVADCRR